jgi:hypothetical protein
MQIRSDLIDVMKIFAKEKSYLQSTLQLGVMILDIYMDTCRLGDVLEHSKFVGLVCLMLAAKYEDFDEIVCSIKDVLGVIELSNEIGVNFRCPEKYTEAQISAGHKEFNRIYYTIEFAIFKAINFSFFPSSMTFLDIFQQVVVTEDDMTHINEDKTNRDFLIESLDELKCYANDNIQTFSDILLYEIEFYQFLPSKLAAGIVAATRKILHLKNVWNIHLEVLTRCKFEDIKTIMDSLIDKYMNYNFSDMDIDFEDDSGYVEESPITIPKSINGRLTPPRSDDCENGACNQSKKRKL